jgi:putative transposase
VPYVPLSHPFVERLIGTVRRKYLDQVPFWCARDLDRKLASSQDYYNSDRVHRGLDRAPPNTQDEITDRKFARLDNYRWKKHYRGLYQLPVAA